MGECDAFVDEDPEQVVYDTALGGMPDANQTTYYLKQSSLSSAMADAGVGSYVGLLLFAVYFVVAVSLLSDCMRGSWCAGRRHFLGALVYVSGAVLTGFIAIELSYQSCGLLDTFRAVTAARA